LEKGVFGKAITREARVCNTYKMNLCINILAFRRPKGGERRRKKRPFDPVLGFGMKNVILSYHVILNVSQIIPQNTCIQSQKIQPTL
jgi:hypothetical protein